MRAAPASPGLERFEACFAGHAFAPHRHDTYAIGDTVEGVQMFRYRGAAEHSLPGQVFVLHPDEIHDGFAGTDAGFRYRILYVEPRLVQAALACDEAGHRRCPLPFARDAVSSNRRLAAVITAALDDLDAPLEDLQRDQIIADLAEALAASDPSIAGRALSVRDTRAVGIAREMLDAAAPHAVTAGALEAATGIGRYALARHFRACLGTSPYRYHVMRRLDRARGLIRRGAALTDVALACGFADQSHMTRQFKKAYGLSPGRWAAIVDATIC